MIKKFFLPRGTADILPDEVLKWQAIESRARGICNTYGYKEIRTPLFEETELFARSMGQTSDIVQKQMLNLMPQGQEDNVVGFSLRPEGTASIVRSYIQNDLDKKESLSKLFYIGPMFRGERPQKGRLRQFHQIGIEAIGPGSASPYLDAEVIALSVNMLKGFGLKADQFKLKLNTLGSVADKENFSKFLRQQLQPRVPELCEDCRQRFERNVFRILDCKNKDCKGIVAGLKLTHSCLSEEGQKYFSNVCGALDQLGIAYDIDLSLVRGLDYYTHTVFEISCPSLGSQDALGAGGRYNDLVTQLGGPAVDAIGFALGIERILLALGAGAAEEAPLDVCLISLDEAALEKNFLLLHQIREAGISADMGYRQASLKSQMRLADKRKARYVIIVGESELQKGVVTIKNMRDGSQSTCPFEGNKIIDILRK